MATGHWFLACGASLALAACGGGSSDAARAETKQLPTCVTVTGELASPLIDDFEDGDNQLFQPSNRHGSWFTSNDGTGIQAPAPDADGTKPFLLGMPGSAASPRYALRTVGWGFQNWGAFVASDLNAPEQAACDYDVSAYTGVRFNAKGSGALRFGLGTQATTPSNEGGQCVATSCGDYGVDVPLTADWAEIDVPFAALALPSWASPAPWTPDQVLRLTYWVRTGDFDFWIDDIAFY